MNAGVVNNDSNQIKEFIGKSFSVGRYNVVVEDVIAEGKPFLGQPTKISVLFCSPNH